MAGILAAPLLTPIEQASAAKECALDNVNMTWRKLTAVYARNAGPLLAIEPTEVRLQKRIQRAQTGWRRERRRCKKRGLQRAQKRIDVCIWEWRPVGTTRSRLVGEIARAKARHEFARQALDQAKEAERMAGILYSENETREPFLCSLQEIEALHERIANDKHHLVVKAGIPKEYQDDTSVMITRDEDGNTHFYFGGLARPDGLDHGHYVMDAAYAVFYQRDPGDLHGGHNYVPEHQLTAAAC